MKGASQSAREAIPIFGGVYDGCGPVDVDSRGSELGIAAKSPALDSLKAELKTKEERSDAKGVGKSEKAALKQQIADLKAQIAKAGGTLKTPAGKTPAEIKDLPTGAYTVVFSRPGWPDQPVEMMVAKDKVAEAAGEFAQGDARGEK